jgi:sensor c-di-GMP phosphodiesterase-like protein
MNELILFIGVIIIIIISIIGGIMILIISNTSSSTNSNTSSSTSSSTITYQNSNSNQNSNSSPSPSPSPNPSPNLNVCLSYNYKGDTLNTRDSLTQCEGLKSSNSSQTFVMQADGNLVQYFDGKPTWSSKTDGKGTPPYVFTLQQDNNMVVYDSKGSMLWSSNTNKGPLNFSRFNIMSGGAYLRSAQGEVLYVMPNNN